jgi:putative ABC transport system permease protein
VSSGNRVRFTLVGVQVALAVTLLAGAGLLIRSLDQLGRVSPGFDPEHILTFQMSTSWAETGDFKSSMARVDRILDGLRTVPGVENATVDVGLPGVPSDYQVELKTDQGRAESEPKLLAQGRSVSPSYFATMKIPLLKGEMCREEANVRKMMVNRVFANAYFAGSSPIGRHLSQPGNLYVPASEVTGIVGDAREMGMDKEPVPTIYWCTYPFQPGTRFLVRTHGEAAMPETIRRKMHDMEPVRSVFDMKPLTEQISGAFAENRLRTILLAFFAGAAILLASVGLYGSLSYSVHLRRREVGLRLALGALRPRIVRQFVSQGLLVSALGCITGLMLAVAVTRFLGGMLYGISATDPMTLGCVAALVLAVSFLASMLPAMRAARLDPMQVLRED